MKTYGFILLGCLLAGAVSADTVGRGERCADAICGAAERVVWQQSLAKANGKMAARVSKMMGDWAAGGFEEGFITVRYEKIHNSYVKAIRNAGRRWLFETLGHDAATAVAIEDQIITDCEDLVYHGMIQAWLNNGMFGREQF